MGKPVKVNLDTYTGKDACENCGCVNGHMRSDCQEFIEEGKAIQQRRKEMMKVQVVGKIVFGHDSQGAFIAGHKSTELTAYAYPTSEYAVKARRSDAAAFLVAKEMVEKQTSGGGRGMYDMQNWASLDGYRENESPLYDGPSGYENL